jgi:hypothetical protein
VNKALNLHGHRTSVAPPPVASGALAFHLAMTQAEAEQRWTCKDGVLNSSDVAKAAGCSRKEAKRAVMAYCEANDGLNSNAGSTIGIDAEGVPPPNTMTRAEMALVIAERVGIGRFAIRKKIEERNREDQLSTQQHPWKLERHGRSTRTEQGGGVVATLTCSKCPKQATIRFRQLCGSADMDAKFKQQGWAVDPAKCPDHNRHNHTPRKEKPKVDTAAPAKFATPTPAAIAAQAKMVALLQMHFDPESGTYGSGYSDLKVAEECRLSIDLVTEVRKQAFGDLKVPAEVAQLTADIEALEQLLTETVAPIQTELGALKERVRECCRKFGG